MTQEEKIIRDIEIDSEKLDKLKTAKNKLNTMKDNVAKLYAALIDQQNVLGQLDYILQDAKHKVDVDFRYHTNKINYYASFDDIPKLNSILNLEDNCVSDGSCDIRQKVIKDIDDYVEEIKKDAKKIDDFKSGCGYQINSIINALNAVNIEIETFENILFNERENLRKEQGK